MRFFRFLLLLVLLAIPALSISPPAYAETPVADETEQPLSSPALEARAVALGKKLRCVVCQSESINDSQADLARDMRQLVREKISYGWSDNDVMEFLRQRYGDYILLQPRLQGSALALWLAPLLLLGLAGWAALVYLRRKQIDIVALARLRVTGLMITWRKAQASIKEANAAAAKARPAPIPVTMRKTTKPLAEAIGTKPIKTAIVENATKPKRGTAKKRVAKKPADAAAKESAASPTAAPAADAAIPPVQKPRTRKPRAAKTPSSDGIADVSSQGAGSVEPPPVGEN